MAQPLSTQQQCQHHPPVLLTLHRSWWHPAPGPQAHPQPHHHCCHWLLLPLLPPGCPQRYCLCVVCARATGQGGNQGCVGGGGGRCNVRAQGGCCLCCERGEHSVQQQGRAGKQAQSRHEHKAQRSVSVAYQRQQQRDSLKSRLLQQQRTDLQFLEHVKRPHLV